MKLKKLVMQLQQAHINIFMFSDATTTSTYKHIYVDVNGTDTENAVVTLYAVTTD